jgi:cytochrome b561
MTKRVAASYTAVTKVTHWLLATLTIGMLALGWLMTADNSLGGHFRSLLLELHYSMGIVLLGLGVFGLLYRLTHPPPPLLGVSSTQRSIARVVQMILYLLIVSMALVGWAMLSTMPRRGMFFGLFPIPAIACLSGLRDKKDLRELLESIHWCLAWLIVVAAALHVAAALKHHFIARNDVLIRMAPRCFEKALLRCRGRR